MQSPSEAIKVQWSRSGSAPSTEPRPKSLLNGAYARPRPDTAGPRPSVSKLGWLKSNNSREIVSRVPEVQRTFYVPSTQTGTHTGFSGPASSLSAIEMGTHTAEPAHRRKSSTGSALLYCRRKTIVDDSPRKNFQSTVENRRMSVPFDNNFTVCQLEASLNASNAVISSWSPGNKLSHWHVSLINSGIHEVPNWVWQRQNLHVLDLTGNKLKRLPDQIAELALLRELILDDNELEKLPASISNLQMLQRLFASGNRLDELPRFPKLSQLREVKVKRNRLKAVFINDDDTASMRHLQVLVRMRACVRVCLRVRARVHMRVRAYV